MFFCYTRRLCRREFACPPVTPPPYSPAGDKGGKQNASTTQYCAENLPLPQFACGKVSSKTRSARLCRREFAKTQMTEAKRKRDIVLRRKSSAKMYTKKRARFKGTAILPKICAFVKQFLQIFAFFSENGRGRAAHREGRARPLFPRGAVCFFRGISRQSIDKFL